MSDLKRLQETHEERRQEALLRVEKQKEMVEERRNGIFDRLAELGYSKKLIARDVYDQRKARARWWQIVEEPEELSDEVWEKIREDLCIILDVRKEAMASAQALSKERAMNSSSPSRPKFRSKKTGWVAGAESDGSYRFVVPVDELDQRSP
ncbi:uncharacterized protein FOMMEDRAFT_24225 [Fomitiporia mediterranea MF3/22]|uniref:Uncharacterized protein n=1 Tax=Fomitiporia mediterranea (strain MF3/22) TaxID=694068 RepID=R7SHA9_FOMME|nr:uncharacterized protein FOMMEDRAFT_24225 [Fomitiporia mediterranea MF3/22]EJC97775.1 hypothetical protein FOMMEDRAFT_24225 [Fomitiporia mediterranea MF3/22]